MHWDGEQAEGVEMQEREGEDKQARRGDRASRKRKQEPGEGGA